MVLVILHLLRKLTLITQIILCLGSDDNSEPFIVTGKFGINKTVPTASLHVGTGDVLFDNDLKVEGDVTIEGGDLKTSATTFNYTDTSTTVNFATSATALNFGASNSTTFAAAIAAGGGPADGTSVTTLNSDKLKLYADVELVGRFDSGTAGDRTVEISTTAKTTNFLTSVTNANISAASLNGSLVLPTSPLVTPQAQQLSIITLQFLAI